MTLARLRQTCRRRTISPSVVAAIDMATVGNGGEMDDDVHAFDQRVPVYVVLEIGYFIHSIPSLF